MYGLYLLNEERIKRYKQAFKNEYPAPFTECVNQTNLKSRNVYCPKCNYSVITDLAGPRCSICYSWMITR